MDEQHRANLKFKLDRNEAAALRDPVAFLEERRLAVPKTKAARIAAVRAVFAQARKDQGLL